MYIHLAIDNNPTQSRSAIYPGRYQQTASFARWKLSFHVLPETVSRRTQADVLYAVI